MTNDNVDLDTPIAYRQVSDLERCFVELGRAMNAHGQASVALTIGRDSEAYDATKSAMNQAYGRLSVHVADAMNVSSSKLLDEVAK